jgi:hypothetical protein
LAPLITILTTQMKENKNNKKIKLSPWIVWGYKNPKKENW